MTAPVGLSHDSSHVYTANYPDEPPRTFTSITTALKALDKPAIPIWARNMTAEAAVRNLEMLGTMVREAGPQAAIDWLAKPADHKRDSKADLGTRVHALVEARINGVPTTIAEDEAPYMAAYDQFHADWVVGYTATEYMVCSYRHEYAGTGDFVAVVNCPFDGRECRYRVDTKTMGVNKQGQPKGPYRETALQLAAAHYAEFSGRPGDPVKYAVPPADHHAVLALVENGTYRFVPYAVTAVTFQAFLDTLGAWRWLNGEAKTVIGQPLSRLEEAA